MLSATTVRASGRTLSQSHTIGTEVPVDPWAYDRGLYNFMMRIRFVNGKVVAMAVLYEYGHTTSAINDGDRCPAVTG